MGRKEMGMPEGKWKTVRRVEIQACGQGAPEANAEQLSTKAGLLSIVLWTMAGNSLLGGLSCACRTVSSILGLYPLDAHSLLPLPAVTIRHCQLSPAEIFASSTPQRTTPQVKEALKGWGT